MVKTVKNDGKTYYEKKVIPFIDKIKKHINKNILGKRYETALSLIGVLSNLLYNTNQYFVDEELEQYTYFLSENILCPTTIGDVDDNKILFYDGFGLDNRGLAQIYLKGLCKNGYEVIYVVEESRQNNIPEIKSVLSRFKSKIVFIEDDTIINKAKKIQNIIMDYKPANAFIYTYPSDTAAIIAFESVCGKIKKYLINLTDHAFWLGRNSFDYIVEFRDYGASISLYERKIEVNKIIKLPFYPNIGFDLSFEGFPFQFDKEKQAVFFSGGSLYKTFGENDRYYKLVDRILSRYNNLIFWYAGSGDFSKLETLKNKFTERVFFTQERRDLYQILRNCKFYLSTYPICGGLMFQYAAVAQRVPLTLYHDEISSDFLINQSNLAIEFKDEDSLIKELDKMMTDKDYLEHKQKIVTESVIAENSFNERLRSLLQNNSTAIPIEFRQVDKEKLTKVYLNKINFMFVANTLANKNVKIGLKYYPVYYLTGIAKKIKNKIFKKI